MVAATLAVTALLLGPFTPFFCLQDRTQPLCLCSARKQVVDTTSCRGRGVPMLLGGDIACPVQYTAKKACACG